MPADDLVSLAICDLGAIVRGRAMPQWEFDRHVRPSVGWVPSAHGRPPFGPSVQPNPFGAIGDLRLVADPATRATIAPTADTTGLDLVLCDMVEPDGRPWMCCPREFLRSALDRLSRELGARLLASFEHEFQLLPVPRAHLALSLDAQRSVQPFPERVMQALHAVGVCPEVFVAESGPHQFEIPVAPAEGLASADRSVVVREVVREVARRHGMRATFVPLLDPDHAPNGTHIHMSLVDASRRPLFHDAERPGSLSDLGRQFAAGVLVHARALTALTSPSVVSSARLQAGRRSGAAVRLGVSDREALVRVPAPITFDGADPSGQLRLEYRGADSTANPYLALGAVVLAGITGVLDHLEPESPCGETTLPRTLEASLLALDDDVTVRGWLPPVLRDVYVAIKEREISAAEGEGLREVCQRYAAIY